MLGDEITEPGHLKVPRLRDAARRFGVEGYSGMVKADLIEALEYTAFRIEAELPHTAIREFRPEHGQPEGTCALCFRPLGEHPGPVPGRFGWPENWAIPVGQF